MLKFDAKLVEERLKIPILHADLSLEVGEFSEISHITLVVLVLELVEARGQVIENFILSGNRHQGLVLLMRQILEAAFVLVIVFLSKLKHFKVHSQTIADIVVLSECVIRIPVACIKAGSFIENRNARGILLNHVLNIEVTKFYLVTARLDRTISSVL